MERIVVKASILFLLCISVMLPSFAIADEVNYLYDDAGRLVKAVKGTEGFIYSYDEVGNLLSISSSTISNNPPVLQSINPDILFTGSSTSVTITGQNLFTTKEVSSGNPSLSIKILHITDTEINTEIEVSTEALLGEANIIVATLYGSASIPIDILKLTLSPYTAYILAGETEEITVSLTPARSMALNILNDNPDIITAPQSIQIPASGSASFTVQALAVGTGILEVEKFLSTIFVTPPFTGYASIGSHPVCVLWPWIGNAFMESKPVNVQWWGIDNAFMQSKPVNVQWPWINNAIVESRPLCVMISQ